MSRRTLAGLVVLTGCSLAQPSYTPSDNPSGDQATLTAAAPSYDFGTVVIGNPTAPASFVFSNTGAAPTGELAAATMSGPGSVLFAIGSDGCANHVLAPGASCMVSAQLSPSSSGTSSAMLTVTGTPGGVATVALTGTVVEKGKLQITPPMAAFGGVAPGMTSAETTFTVTNTGASSTGTIAVSVSGSDAAQFKRGTDSCDGAALGVGGSCTVKVRFAPTAPGARAGSLTLMSAAAGTATASLGGNGLTPATLATPVPSSDLGTVVVGSTSAPVTLTVSNAGQIASGSIAIALTGAMASQYTIASDGCSGNTLAPAASCTLTAVFAPSVAGAAQAAVTATATPGGTVMTTLTGTGIPPAALVFAPTSHDYGLLDVGTASTPVTYTLSNTGGAATSAIQTSLSGTSATEYVVTMDGCNGQSLASGASCTVAVAFSPLSYGSKSATLQANATTGGITTSSLSGTARDQLTLTVLTGGGSGTGTVRPSTGTLACVGTTCTARYYRGTPLTLSAMPDANMRFGGWSGPCTGTGPCVITLDANLTVTATFLPSTQDLTLATTGVAGATGTIDASPAGTSCGAGCVRYPTGTRVTLTARPNAGARAYDGAYLSTWSGDCVGTGLTCVLDMTAAHTATAAFSPANLVFVTSGKFVPSPTNTIQWADSTCQSAAQAAGLAGTYIGWIGAGAATFSSRLGISSGWVGLDGAPFATSKAQLLANHTLYPIRLDEHAAQAAANTYVNSGLNGLDCMGWTVTSGPSYSIPGLVGGGWSASGFSGAATWAPSGHSVTSCGTPQALYCFGVDRQVNVTYTKAVGRLAFVAQRLDSVPVHGSGITGLDAFCTSKAMAAGLPGSYHALVAGTTSTAASRMQVSGSPWVRPDGVPIVAQPADLVAASGPRLIAPLETDELGVPATQSPLAGANDLNSPGTSANTCMDWTDTTSTTGGPTMGNASFPNGDMFTGVYSVRCSFGQAVYCLQQ